MDDLIRHPLTHARIERGWTQPDLARQIRRAALRRGFRSGVERQRIWKWENGRAIPDDDSQLLLADVFEIDQGAITALGWPHWLPGRDSSIPLSPHSTVPALREALRSSMDRRTFLTYSSAALVAIAHQWAATEPQAVASALDGQAVDAELVDLLEATGQKLTTLVTEQRQHTRTLLDAHLATVTDLIEAGNYTEPVGRRLHTLAARLSQTVGWHRFDQGKHAAAGRFWHGALHSAHASGDRDLGAGVMSDLAYQATWLKEPKTAAEILESAVTRTEHPAARSLLHLRLARARAALGEAQACRSSLSAAERELARTAGEAPAWCSWMSPADLLVDSGQCLLDLGQPERAHQLIGEGMALLPGARDKIRAVFLTYEAGSFLKAGEADQAAAAASQSLTLSSKIGAPRCVSLVRELTPGFEKYAGTGDVDDLLERVRAS
ncbi:helix-turn-helix transcriptional regulator [Streptomyces sp. NPDC058284]|uniref:helix-turn-helix transcriptional regulator n=1 Tax=unclassified Streptomyces TaxID=2593676 RepID=UPI003649A8CB